MIMTIIEHVLAVLIGGTLMFCSLFVLFMPIFILLFFVKKLPKKDRNIKEDIVQAQLEYDRKWRRRD